MKAEQEQQFRHLSFTTPQDIEVENPSVSSRKLAGKMGPSAVMIQKKKNKEKKNCLRAFKYYKGLKTGFNSPPA